MMYYYDYDFKISDDDYAAIEPLLDKDKGRPAQDNKKFINALLEVLGTGGTWRSLEEKDIKHRNVHERFNELKGSERLIQIFEILLDTGRYPWLIVPILPNYVNPGKNAPKYGCIPPIFRVVCPQKTVDILNKEAIRLRNGR